MARVSSYFYKKIKIKKYNYIIIKKYCEYLISNVYGDERY